MTDLELIRESVAKHAAKILDANDRIWDYAELAFHEHKSAELLCRLLEIPPAPGMRQELEIALR